ncbi:transcription antiterminator [Brevibacillus sp. SYP-B805]|uniref:glucose PTS transporter transcription antiterminator GlcT n=1 Tax=Brevibacillus sp. SYP-B805 TaxID=1578199 RepID=UPI0013EBAD2B|nr:PRD domain-containing protein [Brevibacillus sp. SYP-B805]NGQ96978.1 transcription antiterminator [Brevibacillus sp. SYP-B805]
MADERKYVIGRIFNNNIVLVHEPPDNQEVILLGKGIGFGQKVGSELDRSDARIEKKFRLEQEQHLRQYQSLINQVDQTVIDIAEEIISLVAKEISPDLNEHIHVALPDHIHFAIHRLRNGLEIVNPFLFEIRTLYAREYALAERAARMMEERFHIKVPESESGFLALHIHSAVSYIPVTKAVQFTNVLAELVARIEQATGTRIDKQSMDYARLITHLRYAIERIRQGKPILHPLMDRIKTTLPQAYELAAELGALISEKLDVVVPEDEVGYIAMHLFRLLQQLEAKEE